MTVACAVHPAPIRDRNGSLIDISPFRWFRSIGDDYQPKSKGTTAGGAPPLKDSFLPDQTTRALAEQTNATLQAAVRRDGPAFVSYLDGFIMALREELDSPSNGGGAGASVGSHSLSHHRYPAPVERTPFRMDVKQDGTGIESPGWFSGAGGEDRTEERSTSSTLMSRLCALDWVIVLYESVVPILLKADVSAHLHFWEFILSLQSHHRCSPQRPSFSLPANSSMRSSFSWSTAHRSRSCIRAWRYSQT